MSNLCQVLTGQALLILFTCCYLAGSCTTKHRLVDSRISNLVDLIKSCPDWSSIGREEQIYQTAVNTLQTKLKLIADNDTETIRKAVSNYSNEQISRHTFDAAEKARLFLLNRYIFNVPDRIESELPPYIGWKLVAVPPLNPLWPITKVDIEGNLNLDIKPLTYTGQYYSPLAEFDYFNNQYGRRHIKASR